MKYSLWAWQCRGGRGHISGRDNTPPDIALPVGGTKGTGEGLGIAVWCDKILYYTRVIEYGGVKLPQCTKCFTLGTRGFFKALASLRSAQASN